MNRSLRLKSPVGIFGENLAKKHLLAKGYKHLFSNYLIHGVGEIDLIFIYESTLIFVEVKTRSSLSYGKPEDSVSRIKQAKMRRAANSFILRSGIRIQAYRFDVVAIVAKPVPRVSHYENAF